MTGTSFTWFMTSITKIREARGLLISRFIIKVSHFFTYSVRWGVIFCLAIIWIRTFATSLIAHYWKTLIIFIYSYNFSTPIQIFLSFFFVLAYIIIIKFSIVKTFSTRIFFSYFSRTSFTILSTRRNARCTIQLILTPCIFSITKSLFIKSFIASSYT